MNSQNKPEHADLLPWLLVDASVYKLKSAQRKVSSERIGTVSDDAPSERSPGTAVYRGHHLQHLCEVTVSADTESLERVSIREGWNIAFQDIVVVSRLGEGSTSEVFVGHRTDQMNALKVMKQGGMSQDFLDEIYTMRRLPDHKNIVTFFGVCTDFSVPIAVYEYLGGGTLDELLVREERARRDGKSGSRCKAETLQQSVSWMRDLFSALDFLHNLKPRLLHRDVKPANLLLDAEQRRLKLADFGLCREESSGDARCMTGVSGSLRYMAPEVFLGSKTYDHTVDIWSASMVMWACAARARPFASLSDRNAAELVATQQLRPPCDAVKDKRLSQVIQKGLLEDSSRRPSANEVLGELSKVEERGRQERDERGPAGSLQGKLSKLVAMTRQGLLLHSVVEARTTR